MVSELMLATTVISNQPKLDFKLRKLKVTCNSNSSITWHLIMCKDYRTMEVTRTVQEK